MEQVMAAVPVKQLINDGYRLVHFDLKGAPPKLSYLKELLPILKSNGATGLLMEYEDTFPYTGQLVHLRRAPHNSATPAQSSLCEAMDSDDLPSTTDSTFYTEEEIKELLAYVAELKLEVVPLVQTFGHLEFVLKHVQFSHLRESPQQPNALCPRLPQSEELVHNLIEQILGAHPDAKYIHLGMDEVLMCACELCKVTPREKVFLEWAVKLCGWVRRTHPNVTPIIWDDMLRSITHVDIQASGLGALTDLMVWKYDAGYLNLPEGYLSTMLKVFGNNRLWCASAFKGATGAAQMLVPAQHHIDNHIAWVTALKRLNVTQLKGFVLTGWQRYDHMAILCELLPASIPSLVLCLKVLTSTEFTQPIHEQVSQQLGFKHLINLNPFSGPLAVEQGMSFPGHELYSSLQMWVNFCLSFKGFNNSDIMVSWYNKYRRKQKWVSPGVIEMIRPQHESFQKTVKQLKERLELQLSELYDQSTVCEWLESFVDPVLEDIGSSLTECLELSKQDTSLCTAATRCSCTAPQKAAPQSPATS